MWLSTNKSDISPAEEWLVDARRWLRILKNPELRSPAQWLRQGPEIDHLRVGALNHLAKNLRPAALPPVPVLIPCSDGEGDLSGER